MKKMIAMILVLALAVSLCACEELEKLQQVELPPMPTVEPSQEPETQVTEAPQVSEEPVAKADLGSRVIVNISGSSQVYNAPDNEEQRILTFSYDTPQVHIEGNDAASDAINDHIAVLNELYYSGTGNGDGLNSWLEMALDNYSYAVDTGAEIGLELSSDRTASVSRADSSVVSLVLSTITYMGGVHGDYSDRGYVYDTQTGELLTLEKLSDDPETFKQFVLEYITELAENGEEYKDCSFRDTTEDLNTALAALLREGSWYLDEKGLVVFSDVYELGSYAEGIIRFTIPYSELAEHIKAKWLPVERPSGDGSFTVSLQSDVAAGSVELLDKVTVSDSGEELCLKAEGTVYDISISSVEYADYNHKFFETDRHWNCSYMENCAIQLLTDIPDGMPDLMIRYTTADGTAHQYLISQSGEDGSIILIDAESVEAIG